MMLLLCVVLCEFIPLNRHEEEMEEEEEVTKLPCISKHTHIKFE